jgi:hypothetical protein
VDQNLKQFVFQWLGVASGTLMAVIFVAFFSMPLALGFHPGESLDRVEVNSMHMT